ncbi:hypothetical protein Hanom_Chr09g00861861 [Helianthus anomalus]
MVGVCTVRFGFWVKSKPKPKCRFSGFKNRSVSVFFGFGFSVFTSVRFGFSVISVFGTKLCKIQKIRSIIYIITIFLYVYI